MAWRRAGAPARARAVAALYAHERPVQPAQARRSELRGDVVQLERVAPQVVVLAFAGDVLHVQAVRHPDRLIARRVARAAYRQVRISGVVHAPMVLDQNLFGPSRHTLAVHQREQAVPVDARRDRRTGQFLEARAEVDVLGHRADRATGRHAWAGDHERDFDVRVERRQLARPQAVLAHVQAVVGAEHDVGVTSEALRDKLLLDRADHPVDRLNRLGAHAELGVDLRDLRAAERFEAAQPGRLVRADRVEGRCARSARAGELAVVAPGRRVGRMGRERRQLEHERPSAGGRARDERHALSCDHVGQVVAWAIAVRAYVPVAVHVVAVLGIAVAGDVPLAPAGRDRCAALRGDGRARAVARRRAQPQARDGAVRLVPVQVLAHQRRAVALALHRDGERFLLLAAFAKDAVAAFRGAVVEHARVVWIATGQDRRARGAAERVGHEVVAEAHAAALHPQHVRHVAHEVRREVVGQHEDDVRPPAAGRHASGAGCGGCFVAHRRRARA